MTSIIKFPNSSSWTLSTCNLKEIHGYIQDKYSINYFLIYNGKILTGNVDDGGTVWLVPRVLGGKGGFGSKLKSQGRKKIQVSNSSCRDLQGNRLSTLQKNQDLAIYLKKDKEAKAQKEKEIDEKIELGLRGFQAQKVKLDDTTLNMDLEESFDGVQDAVQKAFSKSRQSLPESTMAKIDWEEEVEEYKSSDDE